MKEHLEIAGEALSLLAAAILVYRLTNPDGPEPLELARDALRSGRAWVDNRRAYHRAMMDTLERIRDLPETEAPE